MVVFFILFFLWSATSSFAQAPQIRPVFGTRAVGPSLMSVTDGDKGDVIVSSGGTLWLLDYLGAQAASASTNGLLSATHFAMFMAKQDALGFTPEDVNNKKPDAALGTSNQFYPTQGAVKSYVDNGVKALTNTALTPRGGPARADCILGPGSPIIINADNLTGCDFVQIAELSGTTNFDISGTPVNGQFVTISMYTATQRALTWTTGAGKFAAEGIALPTFSRAADYVLYGFRYNGLSNRWALAASNQATVYGTVGHVLTGNGPGVEPSYQAPTGGGGGGTGERLLPITAVDFPAANPAILARDTNGTAVLRFDNNTSQCVSWGPFRMNVDYASLPVFKFQYSMESVIGAFNVVIQVSVMAITPGVDAQNPDTEANYGTVNTCTDAIPGTAKTPKEISCSLTNNDGLLARDLVKVKLCRGATGADNAEGMMFGLAAALEYSR